MEGYRESDVVSSTMAALSKKKKKDKNEENLSSELNSELKHKKLKKKKQNREERRSDILDSFPEIKQNGPKKKRKEKEIQSSVTIFEVKPKSSKKKKLKEGKHCVMENFIEILQNGSKKKKRKEKENQSSAKNSKRKEKNSKKRKQTDEGSQSSLKDFVSMPEQESKKKKRKEKKNTVKNSRTDEKQLKKKNQIDEECLRSFCNNFTEIKPKDPKRKKRLEKEIKGTDTNSGVKQRSSRKMTQNNDESESSATNSEIEQNCPKKRKRKGEESETIVTDCVIEQNASKQKKGIEKASTSTATNSGTEQDGPQNNKRKVEEGRSTVTNSENEHNYAKQKEGKVNKESRSTATNLKKDQRSPKKRKANSEVKQGGSKRRKKDGSFLQSSEDRGKMEDAFLIQHPHLANYIKGQLYCEGLESSSFTAMSTMLKECILREKWVDANRILCTMCMYQTPNVDCLWKFGAHVLQNHPRGNAELVEDLYRFVRKINMNNPYQKKLEHALFLLRENRMKDALTTLTEMWSMGGRNGQQNDQQIRKKMTSAYAGLIEYCQWHEETKKRVDDDQEEEVVTSKEAEILRKRALANLGKVNDDQGVWDIFITKQVEMLEAEGSISRAEDILTNYLSHNPANPNAHVYLYQFLKRNHPTNTDRLKPVLKKLATILPAEDYTLEYVDLLEQTDSAKLAEVLPMLFIMADYSTCHGNTALWETLVDHVISIVESRDKPSKALLKECWSCRKPWWSSYHFEKHEASELVKKNPEAALQKAILASIFFGSSFPFVQKIQSALQKRKPKLSKKLEEEISLWCNPAL